MKRELLIVSLFSLTLYAASIDSVSNSADKFTKAPVSVNSNTTQPAKKLTIAEATLKAINEARGRNQLCSKATFPVRWNTQLYVYAKEHSIDMAVNKKLSHNGSGTTTDKTAIKLNLNRGSYFYERVNQKKDSKKIFSGELIIRTDTNSLRGPKELINYWVQNPKSCKVIMDSRFSDVALSKVISNKDNKAYWTLILAGARAKATK